MFKRKDNKKDKIKADNMMQALREIINEQSRELAKLHRIAIDYEEYKQKKDEMEDTIQRYRELCKDVDEYKKQYQELNRELRSVINRYKSEIQIAVKNY